MSSRPNILWIVTTQWRAQACGYAGDPNARTPRLDALAAESVNYTQAVTPHPMGPQARAALLTGRLCPDNGVRDYWDPLPPTARTLAHELRERGYRTAFFGKWHLHERDRSVPFVGEAHAKIIVPSERRGGFEFWEGFEGGFLLNDPWLHGTRLPVPTRFKGYQSDVLCGRAAEWVARGQEARCEMQEEAERLEKRESRKSEIKYASPWFCVVSLESPHPPYGAPAAGVAPRDPREIVLPPNVPLGGAVERTAREELAGYYAHLEATDQAVGRLVDAVKLAESHEGARPSLVVFTSVHGDMHGAHGLFRKAWPYEESVRVPLLVRLPACEKREARSGMREEAVSLVDLRAMTLAWSEGRTPAGEDRMGQALISMPTGSSIPLQCPHAWCGVRTRTRKLILKDDGTPWLFFDLESDPLELKNLSADATRRHELADLQGNLSPNG
ncbi:MAG: sulfatase-like hydrolase/transferase [Opitutaceae bacterium]|nr:sulfatase-like hydrolase/transferase [Opitutaceae bacterium]